MSKRIYSVKRTAIEQAIARGLSFPRIAQDLDCELVQVQNIWRQMVAVVAEDSVATQGDSGVSNVCSGRLGGSKTGRPDAVNTLPALTPEPITPERRL